MPILIAFIEASLSTLVLLYLKPREEQPPIPNPLRNSTVQLKQKTSIATHSLHKKIEEKTQDIAEKQTVLNDTQIELKKTSHELSSTAKISVGLATRLTQSAEHMSEEFKSLTSELDRLNREIQLKEAQLLEAQKELTSTLLRTSEENKKISTTLEKATAEVRSIKDALKQSEHISTKRNKIKSTKTQEVDINTLKSEIEEVTTIVEELRMELMTKNAESKEQALEIAALAASNKRLVGALQNIASIESQRGTSPAPSSGNVLMFRG